MSLGKGATGAKPPTRQPLSDCSGSSDSTDALSAASGLHSWCGLSVACSHDPLCDVHQLLRDYDSLLADNARLREALAEIHQYTVKPRWTQEERLKAIRDVVMRAES